MPGLDPALDATGRRLSEVTDLAEAIELYDRLALGVRTARRSLAEAAASQRPMAQQRLHRLRQARRALRERFGLSERALAAAFQLVARETLDPEVYRAIATEAGRRLRGAPTITEETER